MTLTISETNEPTLATASTAKPTTATPTTATATTATATPTTRTSERTFYTKKIILVFSFIYISSKLTNFVFEQHHH
jgi:BRCT domain type II-containing protein